MNYDHLVSSRSTRGSFGFVWPRNIMLSAFKCVIIKIALINASSLSRGTCGILSIIMSRFKDNRILSSIYTLTTKLIFPLPTPKLVMRFIPSCSKNSPIPLIFCGSVWKWSLMRVYHQLTQLGFNLGLNVYWIGWAHLGTICSYI